MTIQEFYPDDYAKIYFNSLAYYMDLASAYYKYQGWEEDDSLIEFASKNIDLLDDFNKQFGIIN